MKPCFMALAILFTCNISQSQIRSSPYCPAFHIDIFSLYYGFIENSHIEIVISILDLALKSFVNNN